MASKVNTKFILIIVLAIGAATSIIGGLAYMRMRTDAGRSARLAAEAEKAGDLKRALDYWGRAVSKEPGNSEYLRSVVRILLQTKPTTRTEAEDQYRTYLNCLKQDVSHNPTDAAAHLRLIHELVVGARTIDASDLWDAVRDSGEEMRQQLPSDDPQRTLGQIYHAMAILKMAASAKADDVKQAMGELQAAIKDRPDDDLGRATFVAGQIAEAERLRSEGRAQAAIDDQEKLVDAAMRDALAAVPNGPETARISLLQALRRASRGTPGTEAEAADAERVSQAAAHLESLLNVESDPGLVTACADLLSQVKPDGIERTCRFLDSYIKAHPEALDKQLGLSRLRYALSKPDQLELAEAAANAVLKADTLPTSFISRLQFELRRRAASVLVDVANRRFESASRPEERAAALKRLEESRAVLTQHVADPVNDSMVLRADARLALAKNDIARAAALFDRLVREDPASDAETLFYSAACLEQQNQLGAAYDRLLKAESLMPGTSNPAILTVKARIEIRTNRFQEASKTLDRLPKESQANEQVRQMRIAIANGDTSDAGRVGASAIASASKPASSSGDPIADAIGRANGALQANGSEAARAILEEALSKHPGDVELLYARGMLEMRDGHRDQALEFVKKGLAAKADDVRLKRLQAVLAYDDPIQALLEFNKSVYGDEKERASQTMLSASMVAAQQDARAKRLADSDKEGAAKAADLAARAKAEADKAYADLERLDPDGRVTIEYALSKAFQAKDWPAAEKAIGRAKAANVDQADGLFFKGRYEVVRGNFQDAVRTLEMATEKVDYDSAIWQALGFANQSLGRFGQAETAFKSAIDRNPNDLASMKALLSLLAQRGEETESRQLLQLAARLAPNDPVIRDYRLQLEGKGGDRIGALLERRRLYEEDPSDPTNALGLVRLLADLKPARELIIDESGKELVTLSRWTQMSVTDQQKALDTLQEGWNKEADFVVEHLKPDPKLGGKTGLAAFKASLLRRRGKVAEGELLLQQFIAQDPEAAAGSAAHIELAKYQMQSMHQTEAIATIEEAIKHQDPKKREADLEAARMLIQIPKPDMALEHLLKVEEVASDPALQKQITECLIRLQRFDEAQKRLDALAKAGVEDDVTWMLAANIAEANGDRLFQGGNAVEADRMYSEQRDALARAQAKAPGNPTPRILLAGSYLREYRRTRKPNLLDDSLTVLGQAEKIRASSPEIMMLRVQVFKEKIDANPETAALQQAHDARDSTEAERQNARRGLAQIFNPAIVELRRWVEREPENVNARNGLMRAYLDARDADSAQQVINEAIAANPTVEGWYMALGDVYKFAKHDAEKAMAAYGKADELKGSPATLRNLIEASFAVESPDCRSIVGKLESRKDQLKEAPELREQYARALACVDRKDDAVQQLREAYAQHQQMASEPQPRRTLEDIATWFAAAHFVFASDDVAGIEKLLMELCGQKPGITELRALAQMWLATGEGGRSRGLELQRQAIKQCPADNPGLAASLNMDLANYLILVQDSKGAAAAFEAVLQIQPDHIGAMNNLAYLLVEELNDADRAVPYAERIVKLAPKNASILDTAGWVYYRAGKCDLARQYLQASLDRAKAASTYAHLAEVCLKCGDAASAAKAIGEAVKLKPDSATLQKIDQLKADMEKK